MLNKKLFTLCLLAIIGLFNAQIEPIAHKPISLDLNHIGQQSHLDLDFTIQLNGKKVTLYRGYAFIFNFSATSLGSSDTDIGCDIGQDGESVGSFSVSLEASNNRIICTYVDDDSNSREGRQLEMNKQITARLSGFTFPNNFNSRVGVSLFTSNGDKGVLIVQIPAFRSFALYSNFATSNDSQRYITAKTPTITINQSSFSCGTNCATLYRNGDFNLSFELVVNKYINTEEAWLAFQINGDLPETLEITSADVQVPTTTPAPDASLYTKLLSSQTGGALSFQRDGNIFYIKDIARLRTGDLANLDKGRTFSVTISGFKATTVSGSVINSINTLVIWKNTNSRLSYHTLSFSSLTVVNRHTIKSANTDNTTAGNYAENNEGATMSVYENGLVHIKFQIRIPETNDANVLVISATNSASQVVSFLPSTCDFSLSSNKYLCVPTYEGYGDSLVRTVSTTSRNSSFYIKVNKSSTSQDVKLSVWANINQCSTDNTFTGTNKKEYNNILAEGSNSIPVSHLYLAFKVKLQNESGVIYAESADSWTSSLKCYKNFRYTNSETANYSGKFYPDSTPARRNLAQTVDFIVSKRTNAGTSTDNHERDYLLYQEVYNWNPNEVVLTDSSTSTTLSITEAVTSSRTRKYINDVGTTRNNFSINFGVANTPLHEYIPLPYTPLTDGAGEDETNTEVLIPGKYRLTVPNLIASQVTSTSNCHLAFIHGSTISAFRQGLTGTDANKALDVSSTLPITSVATPVVNGSGPSVFNILTNNVDLANISTNCFKYYSSVPIITNIYTAVSFYLKYERETTNIENRVIRFFKFFNSAYGFNSNNIVDKSNIPNTLYDFYSVNTATTSNKKLCIVKISDNIFLTEASQNTLLITFLNSRIPLIGEGLVTDQYPIAISSSNNSLASAVATPLYGETANDLSYEGINDLSSLNNGEIDYQDSKSLAYYLGSSILINGFTGSSNTDTVYIPVFCDGNNNEITIQSFSISSGSIVTSSNRLFRYSLSSYKYDLDTIASGTSSDKTVELRFPNYRAVPTNADDVNKLNLTTTDLTNISSAILLIKDITLKSSLGTNTFLGENFISSRVTNFKIQGDQYSNIFFMVATVASPNGKSIDFLTRIAQSQNTGKALIQGIGCDIPAIGSCTQRYYRNTNSSDLKTISNSPDLVLYPNAGAVVQTIEAIGSIYKNDDGAQIKITVKVTTDKVEVNGAVLTLVSSNFNDRTRCVYATPSNECSVTSNTLTCDAPNIARETTADIILYCYNVSTDNSGTIVISSGTFVHTYFSVNIASKTEDFTVNNTSMPLVTAAINPTVSNFDCVQGRQINALANCYVQIDLGRPLRINQTVVLTGLLSNLYIPTTPSSIPACQYMVTDDYANLDTINFFDANAKGGWFVNSCSIEGSGDSHKIVLQSRDYVPSTTVLFPQKILIRLSPVQVTDISAVRYSISTYLGTNATTRIAAVGLEGVNRLTFPALTPAIASTLASLTPRSEAGLCNLTSVFPRIAGHSGNLTFNINIDGAATTELDAFNNAITPKANKEYNEVSIYLNPAVFMRNPNIWCEYDSKNLPCDWNVQGYVNFRFSPAIKERTNGHNIIIKGVTVPHVTAPHTFYCSLNYYNLDAREQLIFGRGAFNIDQYTYVPATQGNLLLYNTNDDFVSTNTPRTTSNFSFRFIPDYTQGLTGSTFTFGDDTRKPVIIVQFPREYNFALVANGTIGGRLTRTKFNTETLTREDDYVAATNVFPLEGLGFTNGVVVGNTIRFDIDTNFAITADDAFFDFTLKDVPTPWFAVTTPGNIRVTLLNDLEDPTIALYTYVNLNSNSNKNNATGDFNDYFLAPKFSFPTNGLALISSNESTLNISPGRYYRVDFSVTKNGVNSETGLSLAQGTFSSIETEPVKLNTYFMSSNSIRIGTSCDTLYGSYWAQFSLTENTADFHSIAPIRVNVSTVKGNVSQISINNSPTSGDSSSFSLPNGGVIKLWAMIPFPTFSEIKFLVSTPTDQTNNATFKPVTALGSIAAKGQWTQFSYTIGQATTSVQRISITSDSRCFNFGSSGATRVLSFTIDGALATIPNADTLKAKFLYVEPAANASSNQINVIFKAPVPNTRLACSLYCADATELTQADVENPGQVDPANANIVRFAHYEIFSESDINIAFTNIQRETNYRLQCFYSNFAVTPSVTTFSVTQLNSSTDNTKSFDLSTAELQDKRFIKLSFEKEQDAAYIQRILVLAQAELDAATDATLIASLADGVPVKGYTSLPHVDCSAETSIFVQAEEESTDATTLRYLQETTTTETTETTDTTEVPEEPVYTSYAWLVVSQLANDPVVVNLEEIVAAFIAKIDTVEEIKVWADREGSALDGGYTISEEFDNELKAEYFSFNSWTANNSTGIWSFIGLITYPEDVVEPSDVDCDWKLSQTTTISAADIRTCPAPATGVATVSCGKVTFAAGNTVSTSANIGGKPDGTYYIVAVCKNTIPQTTQQVIFNSPAVTLLTPTPEPTSSNTTVDPCALNSTDPACISNMISMAMALIAVLSIFLFDF